MRRKKELPILEKITVQSVAAEGKCIARYEDKVIFIAGNLVAPEDIVDLKVIKKKKNFMEAIPIHFHHYATQRQTPFCSHFGICGGCKWQHLPYDMQLQFKHQQVIDNLTRIAKLETLPIHPILGSEKTQFYRNKLEFTFSNKKWHVNMPQSIETDTDISIENVNSTSIDALGFHIPLRFDKILDIEKCYLQKSPSNEIRLAVKEYALAKKLSFYDLRLQIGFLRNLVIRTTSTGEMMVIVIFAEENTKDITALMQFLKDKFPEITSLQYLINTKKNDTYTDLEPVVFAGKSFITEQMEDLKFQISAKSFFQTNSEQAYQLYKIARQFADLQGNEVVYDLYTGTGTIANFVAKQAQKVIGLEYVSEAIADAKLNSKINAIANTLFFAGDIKDLLDEKFLNQYGRPDVVITDPPRAGMHEDVVKMLLKAAPQKIVYVSCNPATQARDILLLSEKYEVKAIQPVDMFPHTQHVENVMKLVLKH